jgi:hypothetical protein
MSSTATSRNGIRRIGALLCLLAFCVGPAKFLPLLLGLAAGLEGSHTVRLEEDAEGETIL